jgi:hypothetical protein
VGIGGSSWVLAAVVVVAGADIDAHAVGETELELAELSGVEGNEIELPGF